VKGPIRGHQTPQQMVMTASQFYSLIAKQVAEMPDVALELKAIEDAIKELPLDQPVPVKITLMRELAEAMAVFQAEARRIKDAYLAAYPAQPAPLIQVAQPSQVPKVNGHNRLKLL
jgi:hypothetical protein